MKVALFITCFNDLLFPDVGKAVVTLLSRLGHEVDFPEGQTCCGQMHFNTGYRDECVPLVRRFDRAFAGYDAIVTPSASCAAMVRQHHAAVADPQRRPGPQRVRRRDLAARLRADRVPGRRARRDRRRRRVPAHASPSTRPATRLRLLSIGDRPRRLLEAVDGLDARRPARRRPSAAASAGRSRSRTPTRRWRWARTRSPRSSATGAEVLAAADTSCLMHLGGLLSRQRSPVRVMHLAEILASTGDPR